MLLSPKYLILFFIVVSFSRYEAAQLIQLSNGHFITGSGCGISTDIKYLNVIPENLDNFECSFISPNNHPPSKLN